MQFVSIDSRSAVRPRTGENCKILIQQRVASTVVRCDGRHCIEIVQAIAIDDKAVRHGHVVPRHVHMRRARAVRRLHIPGSCGRQVARLDWRCPRIPADASVVALCPHPEVVPRVRR